MQDEPRPVAGWPRLALRAVGGGLLIATAAIHLDLYLTGYRTIPTIGPLFLLQVIAAFALGLAVLAIGSRWPTASWLAAAAGAGFALATLGGYLLSLWFGLFGFKEVRTTAGIVAGVIEVAAVAVLGTLAVTPPPGTAPARMAARVPHAGWLVAGVSVVALAVLSGSVAEAGGSGSTVSAGGGLRTARIGGAAVLVNAKGFTLYWFAPDTPTRSNCNGSCAGYWPPVKGPVTAAGVAGRLGTIKRADGSLQATYNGHPLYTYIGDSGPGKASGNGLNLNGGIWHEVTVAG
jgi:predicted lipoprotein with Yx(FWY)xxD motif